jgi:hypothetical protein
MWHHMMCRCRENYAILFGYCGIFYKYGDKYTSYKNGRTIVNSRDFYLLLFEGE